MIALALSCDPKLLIADEPTTALDVTVQAQILDLLLRAQQERQMALILITHNLGVVAGMADEIAVMYAGRIVERGIATDVLQNPRMPYTDALLRCAPTLDTTPQTRLAAIPGRPPLLLDPPPGCCFAPRCDFADAHCRAEAPALQQNASHAFACWHPRNESERSAAHV
jgi:peptide/nickel transport system ATP-binding protein